eukprot:scaffold57908_cov22-Tisochrysis_lutea.AAC.8
MSMLLLRTGAVELASINLVRKGVPVQESFPLVRAVFWVNACVCASVGADVYVCVFFTRTPTRVLLPAFMGRAGLCAAVYLLVSMLVSVLQVRALACCNRPALTHTHNTYTHTLTHTVCQNTHGHRSEHTLPVTGLWVGQNGAEGASLVASCSLDRSCKLHRLSDGALLASVQLQVCAVVCSALTVCPRLRVSEVSRFTQCHGCYGAYLVASCLLDCSCELPRLSVGALLASAHLQVRVGWPITANVCAQAYAKHSNGPLYVH